MPTAAPQSIPNRTRPRSIAKPTCTSPRAIRAVHFPATIDAGRTGVDASRRSSPSLRSMTSWMPPLLSSTSMVNMTIVPGMACA